MIEIVEYYVGRCQYCGMEMRTSLNEETGELLLRSHEEDCPDNPINECCGSCETYIRKTAFQYNDNDWVYGVPNDETIKKYKMCSYVDCIVSRYTAGCIYYKRPEQGEKKK